MLNSVWVIERALLVRISMSINASSNCEDLAALLTPPTAVVAAFAANPKPPVRITQTPMLMSASPAKSPTISLRMGGGINLSHATSAEKYAHNSGSSVATKYRVLSDSLVPFNNFSS